MRKNIKQHLLPIVVTLFSLLGGNLIEPYIPSNVLALLVLIIAVTISAALWKNLKNKLPIFITSILALTLHFFRDIVLARQIALTILIAGCVMVLLHVLGWGEPRNRR